MEKPFSKSQQITNKVTDINLHRKIHSIEELDSIIIELDEAAAISDDELRKVFQTFSMDYSLNVQYDPNSDQYRKVQFDIYEYLTKKKYSPNNEISIFDVDSQVLNPFPYCTESYETIGNQLIAIGHIIKTMALRPRSSILEFGPGWGNTTVNLSRMGYEVTAVDIEQRFIDLITKRAKNKHLNIETILGDFQIIHTLQRKWDAVLFFECFHHCAEFPKLIEGLDKVVNPGGKVIFAAEPITDGFPIPWGFRLDGESLWAIRRNGWCELGFQESYFRDIMSLNGWQLSKHVCADTPWGVIFVATRK
jgi:2-polyprenyl-3-methyl-5-hydroxy-6-metoxy-1,4-benzoquinol methylase